MLAVAAVAAAVLAPSANAAAGMVNPQIAGLQVALRAWGMYAGAIDGIAGPRTASGLHRFQRKMGIPAGVADARTRAKLGPLGRPLFGSRNLHRGDFGWDVSVLQFVLARAGLYQGALDGYLDGTTAAALRSYQRTVHLTVDGVAGPRTLASIAYHARVPVRPRPASSAPPATRMTVVYVVRSGDSLTAIARRYHTSVRALARMNRLDPSKVLLIGTHLRVPGAAPPASLPDASPQEVRSLLDAWSARFGVDDHLVRALAWMESGYQPKLVSSAGARGVLQLLPETKQYVATVILGKPLQPGVSGDVEAGVLLLKHLLGAFNGNEHLALAAWYQGERAVRTDGIYAVTKPFVSDVLALKARM
jgi:LysM repeat protein